jgi:hypothetical protein
MRQLISAAFLFGIIAGTAQAMPLASPDMAPNPNIIQVAGGCGAGWHRGPYGGCLRNYADPGAHACPRGFHIGPGGGCVGNGR